MRNRWRVEVETDHTNVEADGYTVAADVTNDDACLIAAAPIIYKELKRLLDDAEQSEFEDWLAREAPSGGVGSVEAQWKMSSDYLDFFDEWQPVINALTEARGE